MDHGKKKFEVKNSSSNFDNQVRRKRKKIKFYFFTTYL